LMSLVFRTKTNPMRGKKNNGNRDLIPAVWVHEKSHTLVRKTVATTRMDRSNPMREKKNASLIVMWKHSSSAVLEDHPSKASPWTIVLSTFYILIQCWSVWFLLAQIVPQGRYLRSILVVATVFLTRVWIFHELKLQASNLYCHCC